MKDKLRAYLQQNLWARRLAIVICGPIFLSMLFIVGIIEMLFLKGVVNSARNFYQNVRAYYRHAFKPELKSYYMELLDSWNQ